MRELIAAAILATAFPGAVSAQPPATASAEPITIEYYYRIKWGGADEFKRLYERNHAPLLREMQRAGFITAMKTEEPFTHMAGGVRWDLRVTITYRDAPSAVVVGGTYDKVSDAAKARLYPDEKKFSAEEARRFSLLEDHWDVIVTASSD